MKDIFKSLDLNLLRVFEALIQEENVTRAAARLHLTQPAVSNTLARLRELFGDVLFEKTRGGMVATSVAREQWAMLEPHYRGIRHALTPQSFDPMVHSGSLRMAMTDFTMEKVLPGLMQHLQRHAPCLRVEVVQYSLAQTPAMLESGAVDLAIGTLLTDTGARSSVKSQVMWRVDFSLLMRKDNPLALIKRPRLSAMLKARHVDVLTHNMTQGAYDQILFAHGLRRNLVLTVPSFQQALAVLAATDCVALLPTSLASGDAFAGLLVTKPAPIPQAPRDLRIMWHERATDDPLSRWMREVLLSLFSRPQSQAVQAA